MKKQCNNCSKTFQITKSDQDFYDKLNFLAPTLCPDCRVQRRMAWRNDRTFYVRKCDLTGEEFVSGYPESAPFPVYKPDAWYSDDWDPLKYGRDYNYSKTFFENWYELYKEVPKLGIDIVNCENSDFCNYCGDEKNCYLDIAGEANEDCYFNLFTKYSKNCADCTFVYKSELTYESISCYNCHNVRYSMYVDDSFDCAFSFDLKGCSNVLFSANLRNQKYMIYNKQYSKEEYEKELKKYNFGSYKEVQKYIKQYRELLQKAIHRDTYVSKSEDCTGNNIKNSKNTKYAFNITDCENSKFLFDVLDAKDCYDLSYSLYDPEGSLELISTLNMKFSAFSMASHYCANTFYSDQCNNSSDLFGCIGLNKQKFCILNKQYSEQDYQKEVNKISEQMKQSGEWGEFFPNKYAPFAYNETVAYEYFPLFKEDCIARGFAWKDANPKDYQKQSYQIPDDIVDVSEKITQNLLSCIDCEKNYKIVAQELALYKQMILPIPRKCPDCRHRERIKQRNPRQLWYRQCMCTQPEHTHKGRPADNAWRSHAGRCPIEFETTYSPERKEIIYCETCYQKEII
ncbi:MAG: zinc-ribbon domain containing protein [bacterium]|nr:zinc-ribbon domain containing protein [bacterium]